MTQKEDRKSSRTLRNYGLGAAILRDIGIRKMIVLSEKLKIPSMNGYGLEVIDYLPPGKYLMGQNIDDLELSNIDRSSYRLRIICSLFNEKYTKDFSGFVFRA